jgi:iron complex outermembrane receptor protein
MNGFRNLRLALVCSAATLAACPYGVASAQDAGAPGPAAEDEGEAIIVTGSRIVRRDYESNSPIVTVNEDVLKASGTSSIEANLNRLPQFAPDKTPDLGGDIQPTATNTPGAATVSLRNLGANRSLVLINGRRTTPSNASMVVDVNTIPAAAVERVEIISGGASSTYGADAVGGVVNFIMKQNFEGIVLDGQASISERGDGFEYTLSGVMGANFDDGRGNVSIAMSTNRREDAHRRDRPWFRDFFRNPNIGGTEFFPDFSAVDFAFNPTSAAAVAAATGSPASGIIPNDRIWFNPDNSIFTGFFQSVTSTPALFDGDLTGIKWKTTADGKLAQNYTNELLTIPLKRYNVYVRGNYEINDWIGVFAESSFSSVSVHTNQQPSPSVNGWSVFVPRDGRAIPATLTALLDGRADPASPYQLVYYLDYADRTSDVDVTTYNMLAGFEGSIPGSDWTWELFGSNGRSDTASYQTGFASLERLRAVIGAPNWGAGFSSQGNAAFGGFGASTATCTSGIDPFNFTQVISPDCIEAISTDIKTRSIMDQSIFELNAQGSLFELPAGPLKAAVGLSRRENDYKFLNDTLTTQGRSFLDQAVGLFPSGNSFGNIVAKEAYGELLIPVLRDTLVRELSLELGARYSDYNTTGTAWTYKALGDLRFNDWLRVRGGFNRAVRAPNIAELYLAPQQTFAFSAGGDPCSTLNTLPWSANPAANPNAAQVRALCTSIMNRNDTGAQDTAARFYANPAAQTIGGTFAFPTLLGNPNVGNETADTWTVGAVINSPFEAPALSALRLSIDYYNIKVANAIGAQSIDVVHQQCFSEVYNPTFSEASPFCAGVARVTGDGAIGNVKGTFFNNGRFRTSGVDFQLDWSMDVGPGTLSVNSNTNYLISMKSSELPGNPLVEYAGTFGPVANGLNRGSYRWRMLNTFTYSVGSASLSLMWRHLPPIKSVTAATNPATTSVGAPAYDMFNLSGTYGLFANVTLRAGIDNLFDRAPPLEEVNEGLVGHPFLLPGGSFSNQYDLVGRRFYAGVTMKF